MFGALNFTFNRRNICLAISATALKKLFLFSYLEKKGGFKLLLYARQYPQKDFFEFLLFKLLKTGFCSLKKFIFLIAVAYSA